MKPPLRALFPSGVSSCSQWYHQHRLHGIVFILPLFLHPTHASPNFTKFASYNTLEFTTFPNCQHNVSIKDVTICPLVLGSGHATYSHWPLPSSNSVSSLWTEHLFQPHWLWSSFLTPAEIHQQLPTTSIVKTQFPNMAIFPELVSILPACLAISFHSLWIFSRLFYPACSVPQEKIWPVVPFS